MLSNTATPKRITGNNGLILLLPQIYLSQEFGCRVWVPKMNRVTASPVPPMGRKHHAGNWSNVTLNSQTRTLKNKAGQFSLRFCSWWDNQIHRRNSDQSSPHQMEQHFRWGLFSGTSIWRWGRFICLPSNTPEKNPKHSSAASFQYFEMQVDRSYS